MKKLLSALVMAIFLIGVTGVAFADEKAGEMKGGEMKGEKKGEMKGEKKGAMKGEKKAKDKK